MYKLGALASPAEVLTWGTNIKKLTSIKHRNMLLKVAHGDVYTNLKLFKYRMKDTPRCGHCGLIETLSHKILECEYANRIWHQTFKLTDTTRVTVPANEDLPNKALGLVTGTNPFLLTIHAEILTRIHYLKAQRDFTIHPKHVIKLALEYLIRREKSEHFKTLINDLLEKI